MRKYLLHVLIISFVFLLTPTVPVASYAEEIETYKQEVEKNPDYVLAHFNLGTSYEQLDKHKEAIEAFKQAIRIYPDFAAAHCSLGLVYNFIGKHNEAIKALTCC